MLSYLNPLRRSSTYGASRKNVLTEHRMSTASQIFEAIVVLKEKVRSWDGGLVCEAIYGVRIDRTDARTEVHFIHEEQHLCVF